MSEIYKKMTAIMGEIGHIAKDKKNAQQGFMFRGIDDVYNALHVLMAKHGVFTTSSIMSLERSEKPTKNGGVMNVVIAQIEYTFHAEDGSTVKSVVIGEGMDSGDKASNKSMAIAHKYALLQAFMVPTVETNDPDAGDIADVSELADAIKSLQECADMDALKASFAAAWDSFRTPYERQKLTAVKDARKSELSK